MQVFLRNTLRLQSAFSYCSPIAYNFSTFQEKLQQKQLNKAQEEYKKEIEFLANKPNYTMIDYRQRIVDSLHKLKKGIQSKLSSDNQQTEQSLIQQKQILNAFFDEELLNPDKLDGQKRKEIAMVAQVQVSDVNQVIRNYEGMRKMHKWMREKKANNEKLPDNQEDLMHKFRQDKPMSKSYLKFEWKKPQFSKKQRLQRIKWGNKKNI